MPLEVVRLSDNATLPTKGSVEAAGYDLYAAVSCCVPARKVHHEFVGEYTLSSGQAKVSLDIAIAVPRGTYGRIAPRSGLAYKNGIDIGAGVIDYDYRGPIDVILFNHSSKDFYINKGERIAQLILEKIADNEDVMEVKSLTPTERGSGGFGSTGK